MLLLLGCFSPDPSTVSHQIMGVPANVERALLGLRSRRASELAGRWCAARPLVGSLWEKWVQ